MRSVNICAQNWSGVRASFAESFLDRLLGVTSGASEVAILIETRSVHTFGIGHPLRIVGVDSRMKVVVDRILNPNRLAYFPKARLVLELPSDAAAPQIGSRIWISDV